MSRVVRKAHSIAFGATMRAHAAVGLPAMTRAERDAYAAVLLAAPRPERLDVFEWGSGYSTVWAAKLLRDRGVPFHIDTIDNHRGWHEKVRAMLAKEGLDGSVTLHLREFPPFWEKPGWTWSKGPECGAFAPSSDAEREYVDLPKELGTRYGLMLVDARFRRRCLDVAAACTDPSGFVVLHDAQKPWYHEPTARFAHSRFIDSGGYYPGDPGPWRMWFGSAENVLVDTL